MWKTARGCLLVGPHVGRSGAGALSTYPPTRRRSTSTAASGRATISSVPASSLWTSRPEQRGTGTSSLYIMTSGTSTLPLPLIVMDVNSRRSGPPRSWFRPPSKALGITPSIGKPASPSGPSRSAPSLNRRCPAKNCRPLSPFPPGRCPTTEQGLTEERSHRLHTRTPSRKPWRSFKDYKIGPIFNPPIPAQAILPAKSSFVSLSEQAATNIYGSDRPPTRRQGSCTSHPEQGMPIREEMVPWQEKRTNPTTPK